MFTDKRKSLFEVPAKAKAVTTKNAFLNQGNKAAARTFSGNLANKFSTTGNSFVDQFGKVGSYIRQRPFEDISRDSSVLYTQDPLMCVKFILYMRLITRIVNLPIGGKTNTVQRGAGLKHESIMRMVWLATNHSDVFWENLELFIAAGSWKDIFLMLQYDLVYNGWDNRQLDWNNMFHIIMAGLENPKTSELVKKYLPPKKARSKCHTVESQARTMIANWLTSKLNMSNKAYRELKSSGTAHEWQQLISRHMLTEIDFDSIHGKALMLLVSGKFIANNALKERYTKWIESKPIAKFNGFPYELAKKVRYDLASYQKMTLNKQFDNLVKVAKDNKELLTSLIVVMDTSASMKSEVEGTGMTAYDISKSLAIYFSRFCSGTFANSFIEFSSRAILKNFQHDTFVDNFTFTNPSYIGNTNFQSVIDLFITMRASGVPESDFPTGILCLSDGELDPSTLQETNVETARRRLRASFSKEFADNFQIVLWNMPNNFYSRYRESAFETHGVAENTFYFSGFDGGVLSFLFGNEKDKPAPKTDEELFLAAMDQEILDLVKI